LYIAPHIIRMIKSRRMRRADHVARIGKMRSAYKTSVAKPKRRDHSEDLDVEGNRIDLREMGWKSVDWIHLAKDRNTRGGFLRTW